MLTVIGGILNWGDEEKFKAGLTRTRGGPYLNVPGRRPTDTRASSFDEMMRTPLSAAPVNESFTDMWVAFLQREAERAGAPAKTEAPTLPGASTSGAAPDGNEYPNDWQSLPPPSPRMGASVAGSRPPSVASAPGGWDTPWSSSGYGSGSGFQAGSPLAFNFSSKGDTPPPS
ncbi:hypothetical protein M427DRAFT_207301 [Gonapodya prolifera JEL478]|uniref:Uncharacterized protein n=1 Tax=Gonapodya prolifera (strain JEL478) TaxID=1344416 RepID=A0A138ZZA0_GONPJ|nr:hypothetical protein M427DRAFT_207301 [Gonapodya prolifera JEL478]|eukprot:KXS09820.1 hypothetical protein M427DRAFT_207301 [Gonapodya prolifera JEL478]